MTTHTASHGNYFEDFVLGDVYEHALGRTVTTADNMYFTLMSQNTAPIHFDHEYARHTEFGRPLVVATFTLSLVAGQSVADISQNVVASLGWNNIAMKNPVFEGDTIRSRSTIVEIRESASRPHAGIVTVHTEGYNQRGETVIEYDRTVMIYRRGHGPQFETKDNLG